MRLDSVVTPQTIQGSNTSNRQSDKSTVVSQSKRCELWLASHNKKIDKTSVVFINQRMASHHIHQGADEHFCPQQQQLETRDQQEQQNQYPSDLHI